MVGRDLVGPAYRGVPDVVAGALDDGADIADALGVGHRPVAAAGDVDRRGVREHPAAPLVQVVVGAERPAGYPRVAVDTQFLADFGVPAAVGFRRRDDLAVTDDFVATAQANGGRH